MATARDARRAFARGDFDHALVLLWNAVEPHRLEGDRRGLQAIEQMAATIAEHGDASQAPEAARLVDEVRKVLAYESAPAAVARVGGEAEPYEEVAVPAGTSVETVTVELPEMPDALDPGETLGGPRPAERSDRSKLTGLVWAIIVGVFILLNVIGQLVGD